MRLVMWLLRERLRLRRLWQRLCKGMWLLVRWLRLRLLRCLRWLQLVR